MTEVALEWAERNVANNPHISELIEIRRVETTEEKLSKVEAHGDHLVDHESSIISNGHECGEGGMMPVSSLDVKLGENQSYGGPPVLLGVVKGGESFDFCMCNPPFFESMEEAGLNPKTSCGGTPEEMVCPGGEQAFITRIIEDSVALDQTFRYQTSHTLLLSLWIRHSSFTCLDTSFCIWLFLSFLLSLGGILQWLGGKQA